MRTMNLIGYVTCVVLTANLARAQEPVSFRGEIAPILLDHCLACHGAKKAEGGYRVDSYDELLKPGDSGETPVSSTEDGGELLRRVCAADASERMPAESEALHADQIALMQKWIAAGAKFDGESSNTPLHLVIPPRQYADPPESYQRPVPITAVAYTPDGSQLVVGGYHELLVWDCKTETLARRIKNVDQRVFALAFDPSGQTIAVGCGEPGKNGEVRLIDFASGEVKGVVARTADVVLDVAFRPDHQQLAVASADSLIRIFDTQTATELQTIASHADWVTAIAWSDDGSRLASASRDKTSKVFEGDTGELLASYLGHGAAVRGVTILADAKQVISAGGDNKLHRWEVEGGKKVAEVGLGGEPSKLVRGDGFILVPCTDKRLLRISLSDNKVSQEYSGHEDWVLAVALQPTSTQVASGAFDGKIRIWNVADGVLVQHWLAKP